MKLHVSLSMPMVQQGTYTPEWGTNNAENNKHLTQLLRNSSTREFATYSPVGAKPSIVFHSKLSSTEEEYFIHFNQQGLDCIQYCVKIEHVKTNGLQNLKTLSQTSLWRNKKYLHAPHIATWVFDNILLPQNGNILSDAIQSDDGKDFWITRISEVLEKKKYKVYALGIEKINKAYVVEETHEIKSIEQADNYYSDEPDYSGMFYRLLITKQTLVTS